MHAGCCRSGWLVVLMLAIAGLGRLNGWSGTELAWSLRTWQMDDGLPDNNVTGMAQSSEGYLWIATHGGLARFDGVRFVPRPLPVGVGISNSLIRALAHGLENRLWAALEVEGGLLVGFNERSAEVFTAAEGVPSFRPLMVLPMSDGSVWAGYVDGTARRFHAGRVARFAAREGLTGTGACWLASDLDGQLWFAKGGRVGIFKDGRFEVRVTCPERVVRLGRSRAGGMWVLAGNRLLRVMDEGGAQEVAQLPAPRPGIEPSVLIEDRAGGVWLGTRAGGLFYWDGREITAVETAHSDVTALLEDREGNVWVGTEGGGLGRLRQRILRLHGAALGLPFEATRSVCADEAGRLWAAGANGALVRWNGARWQAVTNLAGWPGARATCVTSDRRGGVWVGTYHGGLWHWDGQQFKGYQRQDGLGGDIVRALMMDRTGGLWIGLEATNGLQCLRDGQWQNFAQPPGSRTIRAMAEDAVGRIWLGTTDGYLLRVEQNQLVDETPRTLPSPKPIRALHATADGTLWIGYAGAGVGWLRDGRFHQFGPAHGLPDNSIGGIESDAGGALWFTGGHGVFQVRQREFEQVIAGAVNRVMVVNFGRDEGLANLQGSYGYWPGSTRGADGRLWFAMRSGIVSVRPERVQPNRIPPVVLIEQLLVDGRPFSLPAGETPVRLPPHHRRVDVEFTALSFAAPESVQLQHQLIGWDDHWSAPGATRAVAFPRLSAGKYELRVIARNATGVWNQEGARLRFVVEPFLWQRWWFRLAVLAGFTGGVIAVVRYVSFRRLRRRLQRLEQEAALQRDRARIAHDLHDDLGANLTQIALLSELAQNDFQNPEQARGHIDQIFRAARAMTRSLDEIVWAVNPKNDSLDRFVAHLCTYAPEFLRSGGVRCRLDVPVEVPAWPLPADVRHHLHLAVKETLHNVIKHAQAREVQLELRLENGELIITIADDGRGDTPLAAGTGRDGLLNLPARMREIGGRLERETLPGRGTTVRLSVRLPVPESPAASG